MLGSFAEDASARRAAVVLLLAAGVAPATAVVMWTGVRRPLQVSLAASVLVLVAAGSAWIVLASHGHIGLVGTLLFGGFAAVGAALTAVVAGWRLYREACTTTH